MSRMRLSRMRHPVQTHALPPSPKVALVQQVLAIDDEAAGGQEQGRQAWVVLRVPPGAHGVVARSCEWSPAGQCHPTSDPDVDISGLPAFSRQVERPVVKHRREPRDIHAGAFPGEYGHFSTPSGAVGGESKRSGSRYGRGIVA